jgi:hypothetical protein
LDRFVRMPAARNGADPLFIGPFHLERFHPVSGVRRHPRVARKARSRLVWLRPMLGPTRRSATRRSGSLAARRPLRFRSARSPRRETGIGRWLRRPEGRRTPRRNVPRRAHSDAGRDPEGTPRCWSVSPEGARFPADCTVDSRHHPKAVVSTTRRWWAESTPTHGDTLLGVFVEPPAASPERAAPRGEPQPPEGDVRLVAPITRSSKLES